MQLDELCRGARGGRLCRSIEGLTVVPEPSEIHQHQICAVAHLQAIKIVQLLRSAAARTF
jgi:hypothetical protein